MFIDNTDDPLNNAEVDDNKNQTACFNDAKTDKAKRESDILIMDSSSQAGAQPESMVPQIQGQGQAISESPPTQGNEDEEKQAAPRK